MKKLTEAQIASITERGFTWNETHNCWMNAAGQCLRQVETENEEDEITFTTGNLEEGAEAPVYAETPFSLEAALDELAPAELATNEGGSTSSEEETV